MAHAGGEAVRVPAHFIDSDMARLAPRGSPIKEGALAFLRSPGLGSWRTASWRERKGLSGEDGGAAVLARGSGRPRRRVMVSY